MGMYDLAAKVLLQTDPTGVLRLFFPNAMVVRVVPDDAVIAVEPVETDKLVQVDARDARGRFRLHAEVQATWKSNVPRRVHHAWSLADHVHGRVESVVLCLRRDRRQRRVPRGRYVITGRVTGLVFEFPVVCLWQVPVEQLLAARDPSVLPLVPFAKGVRRGHVERAMRRLARVRPRERSGGLRSALAIVAGAIFPEVRWLERMPKELTVRNPVWDELWGMAQRKAKREAEREAERAEQAVREDARREVLQEVVAKQLRARLGAKAARFERRLPKSSLDRLERSFDRLVEPSDDAALIRHLERLLPPIRRRRRS
jgi:hypothetical protein